MKTHKKRTGEEIVATVSRQSWASQPSLPTCRLNCLRAAETIFECISPLDASEGLGNVCGVTTAVAKAIARMTKRQKLALADRLLAEASTKSPVVPAKRTSKAGRSQFVRSKITGQIVTRGAKGAPRVTSEQVRALLVDFP